MERAAGLANFGLSAVAANMSELCLDRRFVDDYTAHTNTMRDDIRAEAMDRTVAKMHALHRGKLKGFTLRPDWVFA